MGKTTLLRWPGVLILVFIFALAVPSFTEAKDGKPANINSKEFERMWPGNDVDFANGTPDLFIISQKLDLPTTILLAANESTSDTLSGNVPAESESSQGEGLFSPANIPENPDIIEDPVHVRSRTVQVNFANLGSMQNPAPTIELNLFEDTSFTAQFDRTESNVLGSYAWVGHLQGVPMGQVVLVMTNGLLSGSVSMPEAIYQIRFMADGVYVIEEIDQSAFPRELSPLPAPPADSPQPDVSGDDACTEIKVLVAYTPEARAADGGTSAIESRIAQAIVETNQSYINSGITQRIVLADTIETSLGDAANAFYTDLPALANLSDGVFNNVDTQREAVYADMVSLIIEDPSACGLAYVNSTATSAFSTVHRTCATGYYSFGHELGHNMSARHDWYIDDSLNSPYSYSKAFVNVDDRWRTVMAYNTLCSDTPPGTSCTRLQYWSNPAVNYGGDAMGVIHTGPTNCSSGSTSPDPSTCAADNHLALNNTCYSVANFRMDPDVLIDGDELAVDFGGDGLWHHDGSWQKLSNWNAEDGLASWSGGLGVDFGMTGVWNNNGSAWSRVTTWDAGSAGLAGWSDGLAVDFDGNGLWTYNGSSWRKISNWDPDDDLAGWDNGLGVDFGVNGLWNYNGSSWLRVTTWNAGSGGLTRWSSGLAVDFDTNGLWSYNGSVWSKLTNWDPEDDLTGWPGGLAVDFGANGLWSYDGSTWHKLTPWDASVMTGFVDGLAVDFNANGMWKYDGSSWSKLTNWNPENMDDCDLN